MVHSHQRRSDTSDVIYRSVPQIPPPPAFFSAKSCRGIFIPHISPPSVRNSYCQVQGLRGGMAAQERSQYPQNRSTFLDRSQVYLSHSAVHCYIVYRERGPPAATMDTPATLRKRPASSALARQPTASVGSIFPPRFVRSAPAPPSRRNSYLTVRFKVSVVEWQHKNEASIHRTTKHFSIEGERNLASFPGARKNEARRNRERKCRILRISPPPPAVCTKAKVGRGRICGALWYINT